MSSIVRAANLSFKSFSKLYLAERFSLKEESKPGFSFGKGLLTAAGSWEAMGNEAETRSFQHGLPLRPAFMSPVHIRVTRCLSSKSQLKPSLPNWTEGSAMAAKGSSESP